MRILLIILLLPFLAQAQPGKIKPPRPGKVVHVQRVITPAAPTSPVVNDILDTYSVTLSSGYGTTDHEYTLNGGSSTTTLTSLPVSVGDVDKAIGQVGIRVKSATGRNASAWTFNQSAFTVAEGEGVAYTPVNLSTYGVSTSNTASQNDDALADMNTALKGSTAYSITAPNGTINYNNIDNGGSYFLGNILNFEIINGENTKWFPSYEASFFTGKNYQPTHGASFLMGIELTASVSAGATKIYVSSTTGITTGTRFQLLGREKQFEGIPANPGRFEWLVAASVGSDGGGAYINTTTPLEYSYNINWKDFVNYAGEAFTIGKPRIWLDDNGDFHTIDTARFYGGTYGVANSTGVFILDAYNVEVYDAVFESDMSIWPSRNKRFLLNGTSGGNVEIDKQVGTFEMVDANHLEISGATSCEDLIITNSTTGYTNVSPKRFTANGHIVDRGAETGPCVYPQPEGMSSLYASFEDCNYTSSNDDGMVDIGHTMTFTIDGTNITTDGTDILIPDNSTYNWIVKGMLDGLIMWKTDGSKFATQTDVEWNGTKYVLKTTGATFSTGEEWNFSRYMYVKDLGGNVSGRAGTPFLHANVKRWKGNTGGATGVRNVTWSQADLKWNGSDYEVIPIVGHIGSITVTVTTPKSGVGFTIYKDGYDGTDNNRIAYINLGQAGTRTITTSGFTALSGDVVGLSSIPSGYLGALAISTSGGNTSDLPGVTITINNFYPYQNSAIAPFN